MFFFLLRWLYCNKLQYLLWPAACLCPWLFFIFHFACFILYNLISPCLYCLIVRVQKYLNPFLSPISWPCCGHHAVFFCVLPFLTFLFYFCLLPLCPSPSLLLFSVFLCRTSITVIKKLVAGMNSLFCLSLSVAHSLTHWAKFIAIYTYTAYGNMHYDHITK